MDIPTTDPTLVDPAKRFVLSAAEVCNCVGKGCPKSVRFPINYLFLCCAEY